MKRHILTGALALTLVMTGSGLADGSPDKKLMECTRNIHHLGDAIDLYRTDMGKYPSKLDEMVPDYIKKLPVCPVAGLQSYYRMTTRKGYKIECAGEFHRLAGMKTNQPYQMGGVDKPSTIYPPKAAALLSDYYQAGGKL